MDKTDKPLANLLREVGDLAKARLKERGIDVDTMSMAEAEALAKKMDKAKKPDA